MKKAISFTGLLAIARSRKALGYGTAGLLLLAGIAFAGEDLAHHIDSIEAWIASLGPWGVFAFLVAYVLATSLMMPESVLSIMAGALFGLGQGLGVVVAGSLLAASLQYLLSQHLLRTRVQRVVAARPSFAAIQQAVKKNEFRLQLLLRLTPLNPASVSYILGASGVRFWGFLVASLATFPHLLLEVYLGFAGKHVARMAGRGTEAGYLHDSIVIGGLIVTLIVIALVSRIAHKALSAAMPETAPTATPTPH
jgi:uncharacterized membrane protein YdjX (TVP38/TMEM64 family)